MLKLRGMPGRAFHHLFKWGLEHHTPVFHFLRLNAIPVVLWNAVYQMLFKPKRCEITYAIGTIFPWWHIRTPPAAVTHIGSYTVPPLLFLQMNHCLKHVVRMTYTSTHAESKNKIFRTGTKLAMNICYTLSWHL